MVFAVRVNCDISVAGFKQFDSSSGVFADSGPETSSWMNQQIRRHMTVQFYFTSYMIVSLLSKTWQFSFWLTHLSGYSSANLIKHDTAIYFHHSNHDAAVLLGLIWWRLIFFIFNLLSLPLIFNFKHTVFFSSLTLQSHQNLQLRNVIYYQTFNFLPPCGDRITGPPVQCARRGFFFIKTTGCSQKKPQKEKVEWTIDQLKTNRWNCSMQNHKRW